MPGPGGGPWYDRTIRGRAARGEGLLRNPLYAGRQVWNRRRTLKDPVSGAPSRRSNDPAEHVVRPVPELRIVDDALWDRVQARLAAEAAPAPPERPAAAFWERRRPRHLLTGKVVCGVCGGVFYARGRDYLGCPRARLRLCRNTSTVRRGPLEARVLEALGRRLMDPGLAAEFAAEFPREWNRLAAEAAAAGAAREQELRQVERQVANLLDAVAEGLRAPGLQARLDALEARRAALEAEAAAAPAPAPALHPGLAGVYRARVADLWRALSAGDAPDALEAARALIDRVVVHPPGDGGGPPGVELVGDLLAMLGAAGVERAAPADDRSPLRVFAGSVKAGQGGRRPPRPRPAQRAGSSLAGIASCAWDVDGALRGRAALGHVRAGRVRESPRGTAAPRWAGTATPGARVSRAPPPPSPRPPRGRAGPRWRRGRRWRRPGPPRRGSG